MPQSSPILLGYIKLSSTQPSVTFSNIPQTYSGLYIESSCRKNNTSGVALNIRFNGDSTGSNYKYHTVQGSSSASATAYGGDGGFCGIVSTSGLNQYVYANSQILIPNYYKTDRFKSLLSMGYNVDATVASNFLSQMHTVWRNTSAINSVTLLPASDSFVSGSWFSLYAWDNAVTSGSGLATAATP
jgi:hypothetical protein